MILMIPTAKHYQRGKNGIHALQALLIFIGAVVTIALFTKSGQSGGRVKYYFALCWLSIPGLIYQSAFPIFERTKRFANAYAHALVDILYTILWFAAFIAVFVWVRQGSHEAKDWDNEDKLCDKFAWGSTSKCKLGQATGAIGVLIFLLFALTTAISVYGISYYRKKGSLPASITRNPEAIPTEDQDDYNFSSNPHDKLGEQEELQPMHHERDEVSSLHMDREGNDHYEAPTSYDRQSTAEPPMHRERTLDWDRDTPPELPIHKERPLSWGGQSQLNLPTHQDEEIQWDRPSTPGLPVGDSFYPVDTSYHGSRHNSFEPPPQQKPPRSTGGRSPSPLYDPFHSNESHFIGAPKPEPTRTEHDPFRDEMTVGHENSDYAIDSRIDFPNADYGR